ncbi:MAG TPA: tungsten formylmethanofuran dehydrogenase [Xanthobacteraceae bacterium]|jgi:formylmethanofuran dehydrogenase subunit B|nr:tungsten formylmethanofuran dehydrogenase [Xanthobacteraceae bacterium]
MHHAWIDGAPAELAAAAATAARLLDASRQPVIAGLGADVAGARAATALAQRIGAAIDHMNADALLRDLDVMREAGVMLTTPSEASLRADTLLLAGPGLTEEWNELPQRLLCARTVEPGAGADRRKFWLCPRASWLDDDDRSGSIHNISVIGRETGDLPVLLAALRARVNGRPHGFARLSPSFPQALDGLADALKAARFGVAVWSAAELDALTVEMLCGLVADLNATTRFSGLPLPPGDNAIGVLQVCGWMTGFPPRTGLGRSYPDHDPWRYRAARLVDSGEADCVLWISAYRAKAPEWSGSRPTVALAPADTRFPKPPRVHIAVGAPGRDHDGVEHHPMMGTLAAVTAARRSGALSVADAIAAIAAHLADAPPSC